jgi:hypothetical protein
LNSGRTSESKNSKGLIVNVLKLQLTKPAPAAIAPPIRIHLVRSLCGGGGGDDDDEDPEDEADAPEIAPAFTVCSGFGGQSFVGSSFKADC